MGNPLAHLVSFQEEVIETILPCNSLQSYPQCILKEQVVVSGDITARRMARQSFQRLAFYDVQTGLQKMPVYER